MAFAKITDSDLKGKGNVGRPDTPGVTTAEMQQGVKIATSDVGGYTLQNFKAQGQALTWQAVPYGFVQHNPIQPTAK